MVGAFAQVQVLSRQRAQSIAVVQTPKPRPGRFEEKEAKFDLY